MCRHPEHQVNVSRDKGLSVPYFSNFFRHPVGRNRGVFPGAITFYSALTYHRQSHYWQM